MNSLSIEAMSDSSVARTREPVKVTAEDRAHALLCALSPAALQREWSVPETGIVIGRDSDRADVVVAGATISRQHCLLRCDMEGSWWLEDLSSTNGLYLDGTRVDGPARIGPGQVIGLGHADVPEFIFYPAGESERSRRFRLAPADRWTLGRAISADVSLPGDSSISLRHAELLQTPHGLEIRDAGSRNGTWIDGQRINCARVHFDSVVLVGNSRLRFEITADQGLEVHVLGAGGGIGVQALQVSRQARTWRNKTTKLLLDGISLVLEPGSFTGILGPSGAGKTTLLKSINGYNLPTDGHVLYNDISLHGQLDLFRSNLGYVPQDDIIHVELSVYRCLDYIARLRLPNDVNDRQRGEILRTTLETLGLSHVCDIPIERLSGGQRKRVSIAAELITRPGILFLDEPTSGLDPSTEERLMRHFGDLAGAGRTVVITTHILYNLSLLDRIVIVARGKLCFFGTPDEAIDFFSELDPECVDGRVRPTRIFELLEGAMIGLEPGATVTDKNLVEIATNCAERYRKSDYCHRYIEDRLSPFGRRLLSSGPDETQRGRRRAAEMLSAITRWRAFPVLAARHWRIRTQGLRSLLVYLLVPMALSLVTLSMSVPESISAEQLEREHAGIASAVKATPGGDALLKTLFPTGANSARQNGADIVFAIQRQTEASLPVPLSVLLMFTLMATFTGTLMACLELSNEREVFRRERMAGLSATVYVVSKLPFLFVLTAVQCLVFIAVCMISPELRQMSLMMLALSMIVTAWAACVLGLLISALDPTPGRLSVLLAVAVVLPQLVLSGALAPDYYAGMSTLTSTLADISPARWGFEMLLSAAFDDLQRTHWGWIGDLVRDRIGFLFGGGVYFRATVVLFLLSLLFLSLTVWRVTAQARPR